jgi:gamma-glutamylcysteine synthetase
MSNAEEIFVNIISSVLKNYEKCEDSTESRMEVGDKIFEDIKEIANTLDEDKGRDVRFMLHEFSLFLIYVAKFIEQRAAGDSSPYA